DANHVGNLIGATPELVRQWQAMAELMRLKDVGSAGAEALVAAGILSAKQLAAETAEAVSQRVREAGRKARAGVDVTPAVAQRWIDAARAGGQA
ncbi:MAG TPA: DUF4332 domain-containing protein, partial [Candidatus Thermoplasmatota archaeon]|nr:DUF4332 domain-containing protein [Candidatus Thermoplasmatota archaeon]